MAHHLVTGFPGFLASALVPRLLDRDPDSRVTALVHPAWADTARRRRGALEAASPGRADRLDLLEGDIVRPDLGVTRPGALATVDDVFHLAAIYDLSVPRRVGLEVNRDGTRHVLDLCRRLPRLPVLNYVSTCYVSGAFEGLFRESDLSVGQRFNNHYEETKYLAELDVRRALGNGLSGRIFRPSVVVGDRGSGATQKYDGPYVVLRYVLRWPRHALLPTPGRAGRVRFNAVPRDWVVEALDALARDPATLGGTFHLADPDPPTIVELLDAMALATGRSIHRLRLPRWLVKASLRGLPPLRRWCGISPEAVDYFVHPTRYATETTRLALAGRVPAPPRLADLLATLTAFVREHPEPPNTL